MTCTECTDASGDVPSEDGESCVCEYLYVTLIHMHSEEVCTDAERKIMLQKKKS